MVLSQVKRPSSSMFGLKGSDRSTLRYSLTSENSANLEIMFTFDTEVMASAAYRNCFASLEKQNLRSSSKIIEPVSKPPTTINAFDDANVSAQRQIPTVPGPPAPQFPGDSATDIDVPRTDSGAKGDWQEGLKQLRNVEIRRGTFVRALFDYDAPDRLTLSFQQGDVLQVITQLESGWWDGLHEGRCGWFPSNYCQFITDEGFEAEGDDNEESQLMKNMN